MRTVCDQRRRRGQRAGDHRAGRLCGGAVQNRIRIELLERFRDAAEHRDRADRLLHLPVSRDQSDVAGTVSGNALQPPAAHFRRDAAVAFGDAGQYDHAGGGGAFFHLLLRPAGIHRTFRLPAADFHAPGGAGAGDGDYPDLLRGDPDAGDYRCDSGDVLLSAAGRDDRIRAVQILMEHGNRAGDDGPGSRRKFSGSLRRRRIA